MKYTRGQTDRQTRIDALLPYRGGISDAQRRLIRERQAEAQREVLQFKNCSSKVPLSEWVAKRTFTSDAACCGAVRQRNATHRIRRERTLTSRREIPFERRLLWDDDVFSRVHRVHRRCRRSRRFPLPLRRRRRRQ